MAEAVQSPSAYALSYPERSTVVSAICELLGRTSDFGHEPTPADQLLIVSEVLDIVIDRVADQLKEGRAS